MTKSTEKLVITKEYGNVHSSDKLLWEKIIEDWLSSGMSQRKFCKAHGLNKNTLSYWRSQCLAEDTSKPKPSIVPVTITKSKPSQTSDCIRVQTPKGFVFTLPLNLDASSLSTLLQAIGLNHA